MRNVLLLLAVCGVVFYFLSGNAPAGGPTFVPTYHEATAEAKKSGKPMVLVFSASWCPPCKSMKKHVYPSDAVKPFHDKFVWAYLDVDQASTASVAKEYGVEGIPHIEFTDADGKPLMDHLVGGTSAEMFALRLRSALSKAADVSVAR